MIWAKKVRYQANVRVGRTLHAVLCEEDSDGGYAVYINKEFVTDVETLPKESELRTIITEYLEMEDMTDTIYAEMGVFE